MKFLICITPGDYRQRELVKDKPERGTDNPEASVATSLRVGSDSGGVVPVTVRASEYEFITQSSSQGRITRLAAGTSLIALKLKQKKHLRFRARTRPMRRGSSWWADET